MVSTIIVLVPLNFMSDYQNVYICRDLDFLNQYMVPLPTLLDRSDLLYFILQGKKVISVVVVSVVLWFVVQDKANPLATVLSAAMLLKYGLGEENAAKTIENAVLDTLDRGFRTGDIYSPGNVCAIDRLVFPPPLFSLRCILKFQK